ncbi:phosphoketolase family protein [Candidatus Nomurabacteria bacterium]|nr:phosphoketolase family protein [Candidatus Nomurabacteria bacterium]
MVASLEVEKIKRYVRAANYISAAQIYLRDNFLLERPLSPEDIKPRLLGHWGTCPGINFVYANLNALIKKTNAEMMFVLGPGHGFPALQANLFLEGTLAKYYPEATINLAGLTYIAKQFSWPYGFPSHSSPATPGVILEGGELGYSLATSYGAVLDNPNLIIACLVGDGEAETGTAATAWHLSKFVNPKTNGAVLPILHLNGYKISGPTIFGRMTDEELLSLFRGYGYEPAIVSGEDDTVYTTMAETLTVAYQKIVSRRTNHNLRPPMIVLRTPKGWTGIKELNGQKIEGNCLSHQVVATNARADVGEREALETWLRSYNFAELFDPEGGLKSDLREVLPSEERLMGRSPHAFGERLSDLVLPEVDTFTEEVSAPGVIGSSSMRRLGLYLAQVFKQNASQNNFRLMSPDETYSNKLDAVFTETKRAFMGKIETWDRDLDPDGRVMEMLSENALQGLAQGYILTGRWAVFASYEAFIQVVASMADQYAKFLRVAREISWRGDLPSFTYILTSSGWRQEHNGFSHQNPGFIDNMLQKQGCFVKVFFPPDGNTALAVLKRCLSTRNEINIIVAGKTVEPRWLTPELIERELEEGLLVWDFASQPEPDIVLSAAGEYLTKESLAAIDLIRREAPEIKTRFVNILEVSALGIGNEACRVAPESFENYFTSDKPVIFNFHGYPETLKQVLFNHQNVKDRFSVHGYVENGSTTTPFDLHLRNGTSRYDLVLEVFAKMREAGVLDSLKAERLIDLYRDKIRAHKKFIIENGVDPEEIENWQWQQNI